MMGYSHIKPYKAHKCEWCGKEIPANWAAYKQGDRYYHVTCALARERRLFRLLEFQIVNKGIRHSRESATP